MGNRRDKGLALSRYLTGHTGIPSLAWNPKPGIIEAPFPYVIDVVTERNFDPWHAHLRQEPDDGIIKVSVLYHYGMDSLEHAWVGMQLRPFTTLLTTHYDTHIAHRGEHA